MTALWQSINRIRLEFKVLYRDVLSSPGHVRINRIRLEFKVEGSDLMPLITPSVLIESDWNLKKMVASLRIIALSVLIESDWNLKCREVLPLTD